MAVEQASTAGMSGSLASEAGTPSTKHVALPVGRENLVRSRKVDRIRPTEIAEL